MNDESWGRRSTSTFSFVLASFCQASPSTANSNRISTRTHFVTPMKLRLDSPLRIRITLAARTTVYEKDDARPARRKLENSSDGSSVPSDEAFSNNGPLRFRECFVCPASGCFRFNYMIHCHPICMCRRLISRINPFSRVRVQGIVVCNALTGYYEAEEGLSSFCNCGCCLRAADLSDNVF